MQWTRRSAALLAFLALGGLILQGCSHNEANKTGGTSENTSSDTAVTAGDAVATVTTPKGNSLILTQPEFYAQLQSYTPAPSPTMSPGPPTGRVVLQQMLLNMIVEGLADDQGLAPTDAEVETQFRNTKMIAEASSIKPFEEQLADLGLTPELYKKLVVRPQLAYLKLLTKGVTISDADIQKFYTENQKNFTKPDRAHIKRIALATPEEAAQIDKLIQGGQTFESQVPKSLDKTTPDGDLAPWVPLDSTDSKLASLTNLIRATPIGQTTPPVAVPGRDGPTYWLVKVVDKQPKQVLALSDLKDLIRNSLLQKAAQNSPARDALGQQLRDFQSKSKISIVGPQYASLQESLAHPPSEDAGAGGSPLGMNAP